MTQAYDGFLLIIQFRDQLLLVFPRQLLPQLFNGILLLFFCKNSRISLKSRLQSNGNVLAINSATRVKFNHNFVLVILIAFLYQEASKFQWLLLIHSKQLLKYILQLRYLNRLLRFKFSVEHHLLYLGKWNTPHLQQSSESIETLLHWGICGFDKSEQHFCGVTRELTLISRRFSIQVRVFRLIRNRIQLIEQILISLGLHARQLPGTQLLHLGLRPRFLIIINR